MNVILFGGTGMLGHGVLRECLRDDAVERVVAVGRTPLGVSHPKLRELVQADPSDLSALSAELPGFDACFFCLGVSSVGMKEEAYRRITHDLTLAVARPLAAANPRMTFVYISGEGTDSTESRRAMWARVKGKTENELLLLPFRAYMFRPGIVQPMHGLPSKTRLHRTVYTVAGPLIRLLRRIAPDRITTTELLGRAMIAVATPATAPGTHVLRTRDINRLGGADQA
ncbi:MULTISPECIES: NAD-dependent epimerase/dehydratase family protein [unclassified Streptomyces]|uniref:NAD-dependent epimerase/dehydratase family protein n=1 Tax=unclassified Streptomyces TaxID=2593676 RepID=UPI00224D230F|nr:MULTISPECIES: NAD-dependent epimerase/dehydratase family protein [unclassified Streptomyces]MCX4529638.1 epimerase [Streptomyces sp. NBC_01551]MCX4539790.1 epimerase [Streptomyces sp. NBC_01565]